MEDFLPLMVVTVSDVAPNENNSRDLLNFILQGPGQENDIVTFTFKVTLSSGRMNKI